MSAADETVHTDNGVTVIGAGNLASDMAPAASTAYARNVCAVLAELVRDGAVHVDLSDEVQAGIVVTHAGHRTKQPPGAPELTTTKAEPASPNGTAEEASPDRTAEQAGPNGTAEPAGSTDSTAQPASPNGTAGPAGSTDGTAGPAGPNGTAVAAGDGTTGDAISPDGAAAGVREHDTSDEAEGGHE